MSKYTEIFKLKTMLEDAGIPFQWEENTRTKAVTGFEFYRIFYPAFDDEHRVLSAIQGYGTFGEEQDLLEIMGLTTPDEEDYGGGVVGYLTAKDVFARIYKHYNKGVRFMKTVKVIDEDTLEMKEIEVIESTEELDTFNSQLRSALNCDPEEFSLKYAEMKQAEANFEAIYKPFKENLIKLYEENKNLPKNIIIGGVKVIYVSPSTRTSVDSKKLKEEEPELAHLYSKTTAVNATIRLENA